MTQLFANNIGTTLNGAITAIATSIVVTSGTGMPSPSGGDYFLLTLSDGANVEIVKCTSRTTETLTVVRAQEGTAGFAFADLGTVEMRLTSGSIVILQSPIENLIIPASDESTALTVGAAKMTFRMPYAFTLSSVKASLTVAGSTSGTTTVDINEGGVSILSTLLNIVFSEKTSVTAATAAVISDASLAADAEITIDVDAITAGATEAGLKVTLIGVQA